MQNVCYVHICGGNFFFQIPRRSSEKCPWAFLKRVCRFGFPLDQFPKISKQNLFFFKSHFLLRKIISSGIRFEIENENMRSVSCKLFPHLEMRADVQCHLRHSFIIGYLCFKFDKVIAPLWLNLLRIHTKHDTLVDNLFTKWRIYQQVHSRT